MNNENGKVEIRLLISIPGLFDRSSALEKDNPFIFCVKVNQATFPVLSNPLNHYTRA